MTDMPKVDRPNLTSYAAHRAVAWVVFLFFVLSATFFLMRPVAERSAGDLMHSVEASQFRASLDDMQTRSGQ